MTKYKIRDYQKEGIKFCLDTLKKNKSVYLADDTGLGKSLQAIKIMEGLAKNDALFLIICPVFLVEKWKDEIKKYAIKKMNVSIIAYSQLKDKNLLYYSKHKYALIIFDESHYLNGITSQRSKNILNEKLIKNKQLWLSATPIKGKIGDIYNFLKANENFLVKGLEYENFIIKFAHWYSFRPFGILYKGIKKSEIEKFRFELSKIIFRRNKYDVLNELPKFNIDLIPITPIKSLKQEEDFFLNIFKSNTDLKSNLLEAIDLEIDSDFENNLSVSILPTFTRYSEFRKKQSLAKIPTVIKYFKELEKEDSFFKSVIFCYHLETAEKVFEEIKKFKKNVYLITGKMNPKKRFDFLKNVELDKNAILIATMHSIKEGFDLVSFSNVFYLEIDWSFSLIEQTKGRFLRIGQNQNVNFYFLLFSSGLEKYIFETFQAKRKTFFEIITEKKTKNKTKYNPLETIF